MNNIPKTLKPYRKAVGYIRTSTEKQNEGDYALRRQAERIRESCAKAGLDLVSIYEDVCSAVDPHSLARRSGLQDATSRAMQENAVLVVPNAPRLFRNVEAAKHWLKTVDCPVFSIRDNRIMSRQELLDAIAKGEQNVEKLRQATSDALAQKRSQGTKLGSPGNKAAATKASARSRHLRSDETVDEMVRIMLEDPAYYDLGHRGFADLLNRRGILSGQNRPWTAESVKRQRRLARKRIAEQAELETVLDAEEEIEKSAATESVSLASATSPVQSEIVSRDAVALGAATVPVSGTDADPSVATTEMTEEERDYAEMKRQPTFGIF